MPLSPSTKTPQVRASIVFGSQGAAPGSAARRVLLIGSMLAADATGTVRTSGIAATTVTTPAGIAALDTPVRALSPDHAAQIAGRGSELHRGAIAAFAQSREVELWLGPVTYGDTPVAASATITPTISGLAACTLRVTIGGESVDIGISATDTVSIIGRKLSAAINAQRDWPVTATNTWSTGATVVTAKCAGPRGNAITVRCAILTSTAVYEVTNETSVTAAGLTIALTGGAVAGGVYRLASGSVDDNVSALLTACATREFDRIASAGYLVSGTASSNIGRVTSHAVSLSDSAQADQQVVLGSVDTPGASITASQANNSERGLWASSPGADDLPLEIAAQVAVARLFGDSVAGGVCAGEATDPAENLNGLELATLRAPRDLGDLYDPTETESALAAGVAPLMQSATRPGRMALVASITMRSLSGTSPDYSVYKTKQVTVADAVRAEVVASLAATYRGFRLVANPASGAPSLAPRTIAPRQIEARIYGLLKNIEKRGWLRDVDAHRSEISVTQNGTNPARVDFTFPTIAPPDFDIADGTLYQRNPE